MKCAIMQPTYLPWSGYFNLMSCVDTFVLLDDVQFEKRSWQTRNRILLHGSECVLTVPVCKADRDTKIYDIRISNDSDWQRKHWLTLERAYGKSAHGTQLLAMLEPIFCSTAHTLISELNQKIINVLHTHLGLSNKIILASDLKCGGVRSAHLIDILHKLGCSSYLSPRGSAQYLAEDLFTELTDVELIFQEFEPSIYPQYASNAFTSHLSIIDVIANIGIAGAQEYISCP